MVDQDPPHGFCRSKEEMPTILEGSVAGTNHPCICLMYQGGGLQRVLQTLSRHSDPGDRTELLVDQRQELAGSRVVSAGSPVKQGREIRIVGRVGGQDPLSVTSWVPLENPEPRSCGDPLVSETRLAWKTTSPAVRPFAQDSYCVRSQLKAHFFTQYDRSWGSIEHSWY